MTWYSQNAKLYSRGCSNYCYPATEIQPGYSLKTMFAHFIFSKLIIQLKFIFEIQNKMNYERDEFWYLK